ncbi:thioredoxin family protein [bacterium]|jgi:peroxiredoxin|nr:thioredoxin family protein [bacterium]
MVKKTVFVLAIGLGISSFAFAVENGTSAPDFNLKDLSGKEWKLSELKGKTVVLEWNNYECPFVKKHYGAHNMQALQQKYTKKGVTWLTINSGKKTDSAEELLKQNKEQKAFMTAYLLDSDGKVGHMYDAKTTPHMYVIDAKGSLVYQGAIDDKATPDAADIKGSTNYVAAALDSTLKGKPVKVAFTKAYGCSVKY